jgi:hypothetical protein
MFNFAQSKGRIKRDKEEENRKEEGWRMKGGRTKMKD